MKSETRIGCLHEVFEQQIGKTPLSYQPDQSSPTSTQTTINHQVLKQISYLDDGISVVLVYTSMQG